MQSGTGVVKVVGTEFLHRVPSGMRSIEAKCKGEEGSYLFVGKSLFAWTVINSVLTSSVRVFPPTRHSGLPHSADRRKRRFSDLRGVGSFGLAEETQGRHPGRNEVHPRKGVLPDLFQIVVGHQS